MSLSTFRILVIAELLISLATVVADMASASMLPEPLREYLESSSEELTPALGVAILLALSVLALAFISCIGLLIPWRPARLLYTLSYALSFPVYFLVGPQVSTQITAFLTALGMFIGGVIWALIYFSPVKVHFQPHGEPLAP
jgi:hypothetical protein